MRYHPTYVGVIGVTLKVGMKIAAQLSVLQNQISLRSLPPPPERVVGLKQKHGKLQPFHGAFCAENVSGLRNAQPIGVDACQQRLT
jgi:hypothetical protein|tara:strand:- start:112 stop:369 length:258 start_codon:yes stop_codon:yes gene_type:complete